MRISSCASKTAVVWLPIFLTAIASAAPPTVAQLETVYRQIDARRNLSLAERYEAKLQVHKASLEVGQAYVDALENLQKYSAIAGEAGEILRPETGAVLTKFSERLEKAADNPVFKQFGNLVRAEGYAAEAVKLVSELDRIGRDPNLPPSARRSLQALRGAAEALSRAGDVPLAGPVLETYGACLKELTQAVRTTAKQATELRGGGFSLTEQKELLSGLTDGEYRRTTLFEQGLPVVEEAIREQGKERVYLQVEPGRWTEVTQRLDYPQLVGLVQDFRILHEGRNPTSQEIVHYIARPADRRDLAERALFEAEFRITRALRNDIAPGMDFRKFDDAQDRLRERLAALGLPIGSDSSAFRTLLQQELKQAGSYDAELRRLALDLTPYAREYLRYRGAANVDAISLDELAKSLTEYRRADLDKFAAWLATQGTTKIATSTPGGKPDTTGKTATTAEQPKPKDEQTEKLERRAKELAEKGLKPRDPNAPVDPNEAKPVIPEDCTIEVAAVIGGVTATATYTVQGNAVTSKRHDEFNPGFEHVGTKCEAYTDSTMFTGTIQPPNVLVGTWITTRSPHGIFSWLLDEGRRSTLTQHYISSSKTEAPWRYVLYGDGTLSWTYKSKYQEEIKMLKGPAVEPSSFQYEEAGVGVWQIRKREAGPTASKETPQ